MGSLSGEGYQFVRLFKGRGLWINRGRGLGLSFVLPPPAYGTHAHTKEMPVLNSGVNINKTSIIYFIVGFEISLETILTKIFEVFD